MNGIDPGQVAQTIVTYFGGANGGLILAAALLVIGLLVAVGFVQRHFFIGALAFGVGAWFSAWVVKSMLGWA